MAEQELTKWVVSIEAQGQDKAKDVVAGVVEQEKAVERVRTRTLAFHDSIRSTQKQIAQMNRGFKDGSLGRLVQMNAQAVKLKQHFAEVNAAAVRRMKLETTYGKTLGGFAARHEKALETTRRMATGAAVTTAAVGGGMVHRGFSGTVEEARFQNELTLASRDLAGAFKPAIEAATKGMKGFRQVLEGLGPDGQTAIMLGGLGLTCGLGAHLALSKLGVEGGLMGLVRRGFGGGAGAAGGIPGANGGGGTFAFGRGITPGGVGTAIGVGTVAKSVHGAVTGDYYAYSRSQGNSKFASAIYAGGSGFTDTLSYVPKWLGITKKTYGDSFSDGKWGSKAAKWRGKNDKEGRSSVTLAGGGFGELGSGYDAFAVSSGQLDNSLEEKNQTKLLEKILEELRSNRRPGDHATPRVPPPPGVH